MSPTVNVITLENLVTQAGRQIGEEGEIVEKPTFLNEVEDVIKEK